MEKITNYISSLDNYHKINDIIIQRKWEIEQENIRKIAVKRRFSYFGLGSLYTFINYLRNSRSEKWKDIFPEENF